MFPRFTKKHSTYIMKISAVLIIATIVAVAQAVPSSPRPLHDVTAHSPQVDQHRSEVSMKKRNLIDVNASRNRVCIKTKVKAKVEDVNVL
ncbi:hypothetical protein CPC16_008167 [Podila verticillata]|nr:hypothetical protein CPC16_008167 [Podila verticillata]